MDRMDYQMDSEVHTTTPQHQTSNQPRCPYRTQANISPFTSQYQNPHSPFNSSSRAYVPLAVHSNVYGDGLPRHALSHNILPYDTPTTSLGSVHTASSSQRNATDPGGFDYTAGDGLDPRAPPYHGQSHLINQENVRPSHQSSAPSSANDMEQTNAAHEPESRPAVVGQAYPARLPEITPYYNDWMAHRITHPASNSSSNNSQRLQLPIPPSQISLDDAQRPHNMFHQQPAFPTLSAGTQTSISSQTPPSHTSIRPTGSAERRAFRLFTALGGLPTPQVAISEDDDSNEEQDDILEHTARAHPMYLDHNDARMQHLLSQMSPGSHILAGHSDAARESLTRAARRGAAAAVKMVASSSVLASFEKVEKDSLKPEDQLCVICYNEFGVKNPDGFTEHPVRLPTCKHLFGDQCLRQWLKDSDSCPYCRDKLESEPKRAQPSSEFRSRLIFGQQHSPDTGNSSSPSDPQESSQDRANLFRTLHYDQQVSQLFQERLLREAAAREAHIRYHGYEPWGSSSLPLSPLSRGPSFPLDANGEARRRARARANASRVSAPSNRLAVAGSTRATRNFGQPSNPLRTPNRNSTSGEGYSPTLSLTPVSSGDSQNSASPTTPTTSSTARPSSVPTERSPLRELGDSRQARQTLFAHLNNPHIRNPLTDAAPVGDHGSRPMVNDRSVSATSSGDAFSRDLPRRDTRLAELTARWASLPSR